MVNSYPLTGRRPATPIKAYHYFTQALWIAESLTGLACSVLLCSQLELAEAKAAVEKALALRVPHVNPDHLDLRWKGVNPTCSI